MDETLKIPNHIAIILDGNGRWAKSKGMPRNYGHTQGAKNVEIICEEAYRMGIEYLTVYAFSTENWNRPDDEVAALMDLVVTSLKTDIFDKNQVRMMVIGDRSRLSERVLRQQTKTICAFEQLVINRDLIKTYRKQYKN